MKIYIDTVNLWVLFTDWSVVIRTPSSTHLSSESKQEIRAELLNIVHLYVAREINVTELSQILAFVAAVQDEVLVSLDVSLQKY